MSIKGKPTPGTAPLLRNSATAPMVYFDNAPVFGSFCGNIEIELAARMLMPKPDGSVTSDMGCTAHLRCSPHAATMLIDALQKALSMHKQSLEEPSPQLNS